MRLDSSLRPVVFGIAVLCTPLLMGADGGCGTRVVIGNGGVGGSSWNGEGGASMDSTWTGTGGASMNSTWNGAGGASMGCGSNDCGAMPTYAGDCKPSCSMLASGVCGWVIPPCAPVVCDKTECGPGPKIANTICADGSTAGPTGECLRDGSGACSWEIQTCPTTTLCDPAKCGPALGMATQICDDGSLGGNTGRCLGQAGGTCGWEIRTCPAVTNCKSDADCVSTKRCAFKVADGCNAVGVCVDRPAPNSGTCAAISISCSCTGTDINTICNGYPSGMAEAPVAYTGSCTTK